MTANAIREVEAALSGEILITVCGRCLRASCWQGQFFCEGYRNADIRHMHRYELQALALEDASWWDAYDKGSYQEEA